MLVAMKPPEDRTDARERLLAAGSLLFAERGFRAPLRDITRAARCNIAAVNYYYGGKENLYRQVLLGLFDELRDRWLASIRDAMSGSEPSIDLLLTQLAHSFVEAFATADDGRQRWQLLTHELMSPRLGEALRANLVTPTLDELAGALTILDPELAVEQARLRAEAVFAQLHYLVHPERLDGQSREELDQRLAHAVCFASAGLRALRE